MQRGEWVLEEKMKVGYGFMRCKGRLVWLTHGWLLAEPVTQPSNQVRSGHQVQIADVVFLCNIFFLLIHDHKNHSSLFSKFFTAPIWIILLSDWLILVCVMFLSTIVQHRLVTCRCYDWISEVIVPFFMYIINDFSLLWVLVTFHWLY